MKKACLSLLFLTSCISNVLSQSFEEKIHILYSFKIADLSAKELEIKYKQLDIFWQELNTDTSTYLPLIRHTLLQTGYSSYFYFDMCSFLEMHAMKEKDKQIIEKAIAYIQWGDIGTWELIEKMRDFSLRGIDVTNMVVQLLKQEKLKLTNPDTGELFNQGKLVAYLLLPLKNELYVEKMYLLMNELSSESQRSIITLFWLLNTPFSMDQLNTIATQKHLHSEVRAYATRLLFRFDPSTVELMPYNNLNQQERTHLLQSHYNQALLNWDKHSWERLILTRKIEHYFQKQADVTRSKPYIREM